MVIYLFFSFPRCLCTISFNKMQVFKPTCSLWYAKVVYTKVVVYTCNLSTTRSGGGRITCSSPAQATRQDPVSKLRKGLRIQLSAKVLYSITSTRKGKRRKQQLIKEKKSRCYCMEVSRGVKQREHCGLGS